MDNKLPKGWINSRLEEVAFINPRHSSDIDSKQIVTFVPMAGIRTDSYKFKYSENRILHEVRKNYSHFSEGDVLFAKITPCMENGKAAIAKGLINGLGCGTTELHVIRLAKKICPEFLYYFLHQESLRKEAQRNMTGTAGQLRVPVEFLKSIQLPVPPLNEQQRIVTKLEKLLAKVDKCKERLEKIPTILKRFRQSVLAAACSGELTKEWRSSIENKCISNDILSTIKYERKKWLEKEILGGNREAKRLSNKLKKHEYVTPPDVELPENWKWASLLTICWMVIDCHNKTAPYVEDGIPLVRTTNIKNGKLITQNLKFVSKETYKFWSRRCPPEPGDILFTREAPMGESAIIPDGVKLCMGQRMMLLRFFKRHSNVLFFLYALQEPKFQSRLYSDAVGSGVKHLRVGDIEKLVVPVPPIHEQNEIVGRLKKLFQFADHIESRYQTAKAHIDNLTKSILTKAFRGELVPQDPNDEPASELIKRVKAERERNEASKPKRKPAARKSKVTKPGTAILESPKPAVPNDQVESQSTASELTISTERQPKRKPKNNDANFDASTPILLDHIGQVDIMAGIRQICRKTNGIQPGDLLRQVARAFGYKRLGSKIKIRLQGELHAAKIRKIIQTDNGLIYSATQSIKDYDENLLLKALHAVTDKGRPNNEDDVIREAARYLGFKRVTKGMRATLCKVIKSGVRQGVIRQEKGELLRP